MNRLRATFQSWTALALLSACPALFGQAVNYSIQTFAGNPSIGDGGPAANALLGYPAGLVQDSRGNLYVSEADGSRIRVIVGGTIATYAGRGVQISNGNQSPVPAREAGFFGPVQMAFDAAGNLYVGEQFGCYIRKISPEGVITAVAGNGVCQSTGDGGPATSAGINAPAGIGFDNQDRLIFTEFRGHRIRAVDSTGRISTIAGQGIAGFGGEGSPAHLALVSGPSGMTIAPDGTIYFSDALNTCRLRRIDGSTRVITTIAGNGNCFARGDGIPARNAQVGPLDGLLLVGRTLFMTDTLTGLVRKIDLDSGIISTVAGVASTELASSGDGGPATAARLARPGGMAQDAAGNLYVAEQFGQRIRRIDSAGVIQTFAGGSRFRGDGGPASSAFFFHPTGIAFDASRNALIADQLNHRIRRVATTNGVVSTVAGSSDFEGRPGTGPATSARLASPSSVAVDGQGRIYIGQASFMSRVDAAGVISVFYNRETAALVLDGSGTTLYFASPGSHTVSRQNIETGVVTRVAGQGSSGFSGDGAAASAAQMNTPRALAVDPGGNVYIADTGNNRVRRVTPAGIISTVAGSGAASQAGEGGPAVQAGLDAPAALAWDPGGFLWIADRSRILRYTPSDGRLQRIAGQSVPGDGGDGGPALAASLNAPAGMTVGPDGRLYVADELNHRIRVLAPLTAARLEVAGGNNQAAGVGTAFAQELTVRVVSADNIPVAGVVVGFEIVSGSASLSAGSATTGADGRASVRATPSAGGAISVRASIASLTPVTFSLNGVVGVAPAIRENAVIAPGAFGGAASVVPGGWMEIYGTNLSTTAREWTGADFNGAQGPRTLDGVEVTVNGRSAVVRYVSPGQINAQAPDGIEGATAVVRVLNSLGSSAGATVASAARAPAVLAPPGFRQDGRQYAAALFSDNATFAAPETLVPGAARRAEAGDRLILYGVNFGQTDPPVAAGSITAATNTLRDVAVTLDGRTAEVEFAGLAIGAVGLYQINIVVPAGLSGDALLGISVGGVALAQQVYVALAR